MAVGVPISHRPNWLTVEMKLVGVHRSKAAPPFKNATGIVLLRVFVPKEPMPVITGALEIEPPVAEARLAIAVSLFR